MLIFAITNDFNLANPKNLNKIKAQLEMNYTDRLEVRKVLAHDYIKNKALAYDYLRKNISVDSVSKITGFTPRQVSSFKAWITMTN